MDESFVTIGLVLSGYFFMKVALVHDFLVKLGGAERVLKVFMDMFPEAPVYTLLYRPEICGKNFPPERVQTSFLQKFPNFLRQRQKFLFPLMPRAIEGFDFSDYDLVISSSNAYAHGVVTPSRTVHLSYCHSPMRYVWDYTHEYLKEQKVKGLTYAVAQKMLHEIRIWDRLASDRVDQYLANSKHVQKRIQKYYQRHSKVLYPPVNVDRFMWQKEHDDFFLIVSALTPFKRLDLAIQLFNKIGKPLVIIGSGNQYEYLKNIAGKNIHLLGYKSDEETAQYLEKCRAFIHPAEEDFGIGVVEAMACGKPVLAYGKGGVCETVIPGVTGEFFQESTVESMEDGLGRLIINESKYDSKAIRKRAEEFSEQRFITEFRKIVNEVMKDHH